MKYILILCLFLTSCTEVVNTIDNVGKAEKHPNNNEKVEKWVYSHPKPINCELSWQSNVESEYAYTIIDRKGVIYNTGIITYKLPKTITDR